MVFLNSYSTSNFNSGLQLYNFNNPFGTVQDLTLGNIQVNNSINAVDENLLLIGDNTEITRIGAANREVEFKGETFLKDLSPGVLQLDNNSKIFSSNSFTINSVNVTGAIIAGDLITGNNGLEIKGNATFRNINDNTDYISIQPAQNKIFTSDNSNVTFDGQNSTHYIGFINYLYVSISPSFRLPNLTANKFTKINQNKELITSDILEDDVLNLVQDLATINNNINDKVSKQGDVMSGGLFMNSNSFISLRSGISNTGNYTTLLPTNISIHGTSNFSILNGDGNIKDLNLGLAGSQAFRSVYLDPSTTLLTNKIDSSSGELSIASHPTNTHTISFGAGGQIQTINIGTGGASEVDTINIGSNNTTINLNGHTIYNNVTNLAVNDRDIQLNANAVGSNTSAGSGILIRDSNINNRAYIITDTLSGGWLFMNAEGNRQEVNLRNSMFPNYSNQFLKSHSGLQSGYHELYPATILKADIPAATAYKDEVNEFTTQQVIKNIAGTRYIILRDNGIDTYNTLNTHFRITNNGLYSNNCIIENFTNIIFSSPLDMGANKITSTYSPVNNNDIVNKLYIDNGLNSKLNLSGGMISGQLIVDNNRLYIDRDGGNYLSNPYGDYLHNGSLFIRGKTNPNRNIAMGVDQVNDMYIIQAIEALYGLKPLSLNPSGGSVDIGGNNTNNPLRVFPPGESLQITNSGHSFIGFRDYTGRYAYIGRPGTGSNDFSINVERAGTRLYLYAPNGITLNNNTDLGSNKITSTYTAVNNNDLVNKQYVDSAIGGSSILSLNNTFTGQNTFNNTINVRATSNLQGALYAGQQTFHSTPLQLRIEDDGTNILDVFEYRQNYCVSGSTTTNSTNKNIKFTWSRLNNNSVINAFTNILNYYEYGYETTGNGGLFFQTPNLKTCRTIINDASNSTSIILFSGTVQPVNANPSTITNQNGFTISQVPTGISGEGVYLQTWNSRVLYLNSLGGNDITVGSQTGGTVNLNCWNNIRAYNKANGSQYIQQYINTGDSNRAYLESVNTNITISASPSNTYNCIFKNLTLVQIGGAGSTIPLHTYGQISMYDGANTGAYWQFNPTNGLIYNGGQSTSWDGQSQAGVNYNINNYASFNTNTPFVSTSAGNNISLRRNNDSTSPAKMILTNNAGSTTYGVVGIEDSSGGDILSGSTANSLVIGTPQNTNFFFIQDNSRAGIYRGNKWLYNKNDRPHMCWANNPEGNEGGNKLQVRYIKYSGSWPNSATVTSSDNYTQTIALDTLYSIITSSTSYIAMVAGTLNITSSGWYNITITYGQYLQGQIGRNSIYSITGNATEEPFYALNGDILFFELYDWMANTGTSRTFSFKVSQIYGI